MPVQQSLEDLIRQGTTKDTFNMEELKLQLQKEKEMHVKKVQHIEAKNDHFIDTKIVKRNKKALSRLDNLTPLNNTINLKKNKPKMRNNLE